MDENKKKMIFYVGLAGCFLWSTVLMVTAPMTPTPKEKHSDRCKMSQ